MKLEYTVNPKINLLLIGDSMALDSGQEVARLDIKDGDEHTVLSVEVRGEVKVNYKGRHYTHASEMPEELIKLFNEDGYSPFSEEMEVVDNNWFEIYIETSSQVVATEVVNVAGMSQIQLLELLVDTYVQYKSNE